jgi:hypothetical protein
LFRFGTWRINRWFFLPFATNSRSGQLKDRLGDQRGGEWMGADKNSSPKRELDLNPKFTTKDSHTSLPRSRSHDRRTNPRNKPQTIPKRKHKPRSKGSSCSAAVQADGPRPWGGLSATTTRTVRVTQRTVR